MGLIRRDAYTRALPSSAFVAFTHFAPLPHPAFLSASTILLMPILGDSFKIFSRAARAASSAFPLSTASGAVRLPLTDSTNSVRA